MRYSPRVCSLAVVLALSTACEAQDFRVRLELSTNRNNSWDYYNGYGYSNPNYYRHNYYWVRPWYGYSYEYALYRRMTANERLEKRKIVYGMKRIEKAESRYRTRERIRIETGYVPKGPTMYDDQDWRAEFEREMYERINR